MSVLKNWSKIPLGELVILEYGFGLTEPNRISGNIPVCGSPGILGTHNIEKVIGPGIVVGRKGTVGHTTWITDDFWPIDTTYFVRPIQKNLILKWVYYLFKYLRLKNLNAATGVPGLNRNDVYSITILQPPLQEQERIAEILTTVDETITKTEQLIQKLTNIKTGLLHDLLTKGIDKEGCIRDPEQHPEKFKESELGLIPKDWNVFYLDELLSLCQYGISEKISERGKYPILKMDNIEKGKVVYDEIGYTDIPEKMYRNYELSKGDILFNRTNSKEWVGKVGIFRGTSGYTFASYLIRLQCDPKLIHSFYLNFYLNFKPVVTEIKSLATPGVSQWNVNATNLKTLKIKVPHLTEQKYIVKVIESLDNRIELEKELIRKFSKIRMGLMHDLLTGRVRTNKS